MVVETSVVLDSDAPDLKGPTWLPCGGTLETATFPDHAGHSLQLQRPFTHNTLKPTSSPPLTYFSPKCSPAPHSPPCSRWHAHRRPSAQRCPSLCRCAFLSHFISLIAFHCISFCGAVRCGPCTATTSHLRGGGDVIVNVNVIGYLISQLR